VPGVPPSFFGGWDSTVVSRPRFLLTLESPSSTGLPMILIIHRFRQKRETNRGTRLSTCRDSDHLPPGFSGIDPKPDEV
jgi:hypothetical protein